MFGPAHTHVHLAPCGCTRAVGPTIDAATALAAETTAKEVARYKEAAAKAALELEDHKAASAKARQDLSHMKVEHAKITTMHLASEGLLESTVAREAAAKEAHSAMIKEVIEADKLQQESILAIETTVATHKKYHQEELAAFTKAKQTELETVSKPLKAKLAAAAGRIEELQGEALKWKTAADRLEEQAKSDKRKHRSELAKEREKLSQGLDGTEAAEAEIRTLKASVSAAQEAQGKAESLLKAARKKFGLETKAFEQTIHGLHQQIDALTQVASHGDDPMLARMKKLQQANRDEKKKMAADKRKHPL